MTSPPRRPHDHLVEPMFAALHATPEEQASRAPERRALPGRWLAFVTLAVAAAAAWWLWLR